MKKNILSLAVIVAFALTLMASSAMADPYINGTIRFSSNLLPLCYSGEGLDKEIDSCSNYSGISAFRLTSNRDHTSGAGVNVGFDQDGNMVTPTGDFVPLGWTYENDKWVIGFPDVTFYKDDNGYFLFRDEDGNTLDNLMFFEGLDYGLKFGTIDGFTFYISGIIPDSFAYEGDGDGINDKFSMDLEGWVLRDGYAPTTFNISFTAESNTATDWGWSMTWRSEPPVVPEPGTLVLLGTGLIGATIAARRKMKK